MAQRPPHQGFTIILRHTSLGRTPLDEWSTRLIDVYLTTHNTHNRHPCPRGASKRATADPRLRPRGLWDRP